VSHEIFFSFIHQDPHGTHESPNFFHLIHLDLHL
jgi:hypothetical protein